MAIINRIAEFADEMKLWRRHLHETPELGFECHKTAAFVVAQLRSFGISEIHEGIATTGVVALIDGQGDGPTIGLRADMDALPIREATGVEYASKIEGKMHACGHDGHTVMLLGAARYLAETRNFSGRVALLFQPAEEGGGGARVMCEAGVMERFDISQVYAVHNAPGRPVGHIETRVGPIMAAVDEFEIFITGKGGHAAEPHETKDPVIAAAAIAMALQTVVSRNHNAIQELVLSVTQIHTGTAHNIVPDGAFVGGTVRSFAPEVRDLAEARLTAIATAQAESFGVTARVNYIREYPATVNHEKETEFAVSVAQEIVGEARVDGKSAPIMAAEDFSYMLERRPGAYVMLGQGETAMCHHPAFDFNDEIAPVGASFFARLVERAQPKL